MYIYKNSTQKLKLQQNKRAQQINDYNDNTCKNIVNNKQQKKEFNINTTKNEKLKNNQHSCGVSKTNPYYSPQSLMKEEQIGGKSKISHNLQVYPQFILKKHINGIVIPTDRQNRFLKWLRIRNQDKYNKNKQLVQKIIIQNEKQYFGQYNQIIDKNKKLIYPNKKLIINFLFKTHIDKLKLNKHIFNQLQSLFTSINLII
ncbi:unnamed protein product [Paramecium sonneborni]|uniref:Uncharacterized protein n=1 Tax=Paramecium sonneborni TaxID=65129 RepID=A0A8S1RQZ6_9CILI|nr:unnamed protein product [Paramecium sonneborni]